MPASTRPVTIESFPSPGERKGRSAGAERRLTSRYRVRATRAERLAREQGALIALLSELLGESSLERALHAFSGALQTRFEASRSAVTLADEGERLRLAAVSQQALIDTSSIEARLLTAAMREACERESCVVHPASGGARDTLDAHRALAGSDEAVHLLSIPLYHDAALVGALLLERRNGSPFPASDIDLLERVAAAAAPVIAHRREADRGALSRCWTRSRRSLGRRFGAERLGARLLGALGAIALILCLVVPIERRVSADAELVPAGRRLITAPVSGFVEEVAVTAGESVIGGQLLARLDRRELDLERVQRRSEVAGAEAEFRAAMASRDRQATAIARARLTREQALHELVERRIERSELRAPIDGLILSGDPAEASGAPVTRGDVLFEIAPSGDYEVHLLVDEADVRDVHEGQRGILALSARPGERLALEVRSIHPVAESRDGASRFRVRAGLEPGAPTLRPGERGVARLQAGRTTVAGWLTGPLARRLSTLWWRWSG